MREQKILPQKQVFKAVWPALLLSLVAFNQGFTSDATWTTTSDTDLNTGANWTGAGGSVPTGIATFDSEISSVVLTPTAVADFSVGFINFSESASPFTFAITNCSLTCDITGGNTDATFNIENTNNTSPLAGSQFLLPNASFGSAIVTVSNSADSSTGTMSVVGLNQVRNPGSFSEGAQLTVTNSATNSNNALDGQSLATIGAMQIEIITTINIGNNVSITVANTGINSSDATGTGNSVAITGNDQMRTIGTVSAGNDLTLTLTNSGTDSSTGLGSNQVGGIGYNHLEVVHAFTSLDRTTISLSNTGINSSQGSNNSTGYLANAGGQAYVSAPFQTGDFLNFSVTNDGNDSSTGSGSNNVGFIDSPQIEIDQECMLGDSATITISNTGTNSSTGDNSFTGYIGGTGQQFFLFSTFQAGDSLQLTITNTGQDDSIGAAGNFVGYVLTSQLQASDTFTVGSDAIISVSNSGTSTNSDSLSFVGYITGNQLQFDSTFTAGTNLSMTATNSGTVAGVSSTTGQCISQILFTGTCTIGNGSTILASNNDSGSVLNSQIWFQNGFTLTSGTATIHAVNQGSVTDHGIFVQGNSLGGDVNIILEGASLYVGSSASSFTVGALNGDSASLAQVNIPFIINTDALVSAAFAGTLSNYPAAASSIIKAGSGTQELSGTNTYTGGTTLTGGILSISSDANLGGVSGAITGNGGTLLITAGAALNASRGVLLNTSTTTSFDTDGNAVTISGAITGSGTLAKINSGTLTLSGVSSGSWSAVVSGGTLAISSASSVGSGSVTLSGGSLSVSGVVSLSNPFSITSSSTLTSSGTTTLSGLITGASGQTLTLSGAGVNSLRQIVVNSGTFTVSGVIGGVQPLIKTGAGTLLLTGSNTYSGATQVNAGTLSIGSIAQLSGSSGLALSTGALSVSSSLTLPNTLPITVTTSGNLVVGSGNTLTVQSAISGSGTLTLSGGGTALLSADNSGFAGNLAVSSSTLSASTSNNLGASSSLYQLSLSSSTLNATGDIATARGIALSGSDVVSVAAAKTAAFTGAVNITAGSTLTKTGAGALSLLPASGSSSVFNLAVSAGQLTGNTYFLQNAAATVASSSILEFNQTAAGTFSGTLSGAGAVYVAGSGGLTFNPSSSTYTGGTYVFGSLILGSDTLGGPSSTLSGEGGTVTITSDFSMSRSIDLLADLTFSVNSGKELTLSSIISGSGDLIKTGSGTLTLTSTSNYTGKTLVNAGTLEVNGDISSSPDPIVASGALLWGTGTVGDTDVYGSITGGTEAIGTLTVDGNLILRSGSHFGVTVTPSSISLVDVTGDVTIEPGAGSVIVFGTGTYAASSRVILQGSSITGTFFSVTSNEGPLAPLFSSLDYTPTEVILNFKSTQVLAKGKNAIAVAGALEGAVAFNRKEIIEIITSGSVDPSLLELPNLLLSLYPLTTQKAMTYALNQLHPAQMKGMGISQENNAVRVRESLTERMLNDLDANTGECKKDKKMITPWVSGLGDTLKQDDKNNSYGPLTGYRTNTGGIITGIDALFAEFLYVGALGAYTNSHLHFEEGKGTGDINSGYAGVYLSALGKILYANASLIGSWSEYSADRQIKYAKINLTAKNSHGGNQLLSHFDTGLNFSLFGLTVRPFDSFDYIAQTERGYGEYNAGQWDLTVSKKNAIMMRNELGLQFAKYYCSRSSKWILSPKFSWVREVRIKGDSFDVSFTEGGTPFVIHGYFPDRNLIAPGLALTGFMLDDALMIDLYYNGEFTGGYSSNSLGGQIGYNF